MQLVSDGPNCETALFLPPLVGGCSSHLLFLALVSVLQQSLGYLFISIKVSGDSVLIRHVGV